MHNPALLRALALAAALLPAVADARPAYITEPLRLHAGPGPDYPQVAVLLPGMEIEVVGCLQGYQWCDLITPDGLRGWAWSGTLSFSWAGQPLPVIQYGPSFGIPLVNFIIGDYWDHHYRDRPWYVDRHHWRYAPPELYRPPPPRFAPPPGPPPGWQPGWNPGRDREREHRWQDDRRRDGLRDDYRNAPPRHEREREPRQEPMPPLSPPRAAPPPTPGGWSPQPPPRQEAPRMEPPRMEAPRAPAEPPSRFRPAPDMENRRDRGGDGGQGGRGQENRFGGRQ